MAFWLCHAVLPKKDGFFDYFKKGFSNKKI